MRRKRKHAVPSAKSKAVQVESSATTGSRTTPFNNQNGTTRLSRASTYRIRKQRARAKLGSKLAMELQWYRRSKKHPSGSREEEQEQRATKAHNKDDFLDGQE